jgi:hypothetical protein
MTIPLSSSQPSHILVLGTSGYEILYILYEWLYLSSTASLVIFYLVLGTSGYEILYIMYEWLYLSSTASLVIF